MNNSKWKFLFLTGLLILSILPLDAQQPYLQKILHDAGHTVLPPNTFYAQYLRVNEQQETSLLSRSGSYPNITTPIGVFKLDKEGQFKSAHQLYTPSEHLSRATDHKIIGNNHIIPARGYPANASNILLFANFEESLSWAKLISANNPSHFPKTAFMGEDAVISTYGSIGETQAENIIKDIGLAKLKIADGSQDWAYDYDPQGAYTEDMNIEAIIQGRNGEAIIQGRLILHDTITQYYVLKVASDGTPLNSVILASRAGTEQQDFRLLEPSRDNMGNIYVPGYILRDTTRFYCSNGSSNPVYNAFIVKFNSALEIQWCKELIAENFTCGIFKISASPTGEIFFANSTICELPVIAGKLSSNGDLEWVRGYEFFQPNISVSTDGSISFMSTLEYFLDGSREETVLVARVLPDGELPSCPQFDACLWVEDMVLFPQPLHWNHVSGPILDDVEVLSTTTIFESAPYCSSLPVPSAFFELPDTLCIGSCTTPDTLQNNRAHAVLWEVDGPITDTSFSISSFSYCFEDVGTYLIRQTVWALGCSESHEELVEVLSPLKVSLGGNSILCDAPPVTIVPSANRPLQSFIWQDNSQEAMIAVDTSGLYHLMASDGYCTGTDSAYFTLLRDTITFPIFTYDIKDTTLCQQHLPYKFSIQSLYSLSFELNGVTIDADNSQISHSGLHTISTNILGCIVLDTLKIATDPCAVDLYLPTAFSPNRDGYNDLYQPLGDWFEPLQFEVYDRWGSLLYQTTDEQIDWDGTTGVEPLPNGYYLVVFHYLNQKTNIEEQKEQGVYLLR